MRLVRCGSGRGRVHLLSSLDSARVLARLKPKPASPVPARFARAQA